MKVSNHERLAALARKRSLGRMASYRTIASRIGVSNRTVRAVLVDEETGMTINRPRILGLIERALDEIEAELTESSAAA